MLTDVSRYLTADYERGVFNVSQCAWVEGAKEHIVTITSKDADDGSLTDSISSGRGVGGGGEDSDPKSQSQPLSSGAIAGIVVGVVVGLAIAASVAYWLITRRNERPSSNQVGMPKEVADSEEGDSPESGLSSILKTHQELAGSDNEIHQLHAESTQEGTGGTIHVYELPGSERQELATYIEPVSSVSSPIMVEDSVH
jgi:hypothetical protein